MRKRVRAVLAILLVLLSVSAAAVGFQVVSAAKQLPDDRQLRLIATSSQIELVPGSGTNPGLVCRCPLPTGFGALPRHLRDALVATEDRRFYRHGGVDYRSLARALVADVKAGGAIQGGSTITQQLAKNVLFDRRSWLRKFLEIPVAWRLERLFTKDQILALYLDKAYFGHGTIGVDAAARRYFGKLPRDLNLYESAVIVGMLKAPSRYNPERDPQAAHDRAAVVLRQMVVLGHVGRREAERALALRARPGSLRPLHLDAQYYVDWVRGQLDRTGLRLDGGPVRVVIGLDARIQGQAERAAAELLARGESAGASQAALVAMTPDGVVRAMVGGRSHAESQFNRATQAVRQTGSAFKLFTYLAALERGRKPADAILDAPLEAGWPANADGRYRGLVPLRDAFALSLNGATARLAQAVGPEHVAETARRFGIAVKHADLGLALGTAQVSLLDMTGAYAAVANGGRRVAPRGVIGIVGRRGNVLFWAPAQDGIRVVRPGSARAMRGMLRAAVLHGTGWRAALPNAAVYGKTGTTSSNRDAWFIGFTDRLVTGVWAGNDDNGSMADVTGGSLPAHAFRSFNAGLLPAAPPRPTAGKAPGRPKLGPSPGASLAPGTSRSRHASHPSSADPAWTAAYPPSRAESARA